MRNHSSNLSRRAILVGAFLLMVPLPGFTAQREVFTGSFPGVAINGYDAVAYFTANTPVPGDPTIVSDWNGVTWRFSNEENKAAFVAAPEKYAPQYGGYCAYAVSKGAKAKTEPAAFTIVDGKLYLNHSLDVRAIWGKDITANVANADKNWPGLSGQ